MKPATPLAIALATAFFAASIPLAAQQGSASGSVFVRNGQQSFSVACIQPPNSKLPCPVPPQTPPACPAMFSAQHLSDGSLIRTGTTTATSAGISPGTWTSTAHPKGIGQSLHISLSKSQGAIATLAVHGYSNKARITDAGQSTSPDAVRTVTVYLAPAQNGQTVANIWAPDLTAVTSIDLVKLSYDDGTTWAAATGHTCNATPDPMMLISGR